MKSMRVTPWFALRFLVKYLLTRRCHAADATRIGKAADAGNRIAKPVDWLMMRLSVSYQASHSVRRGLDRGMAIEGKVDVDSIVAERQRLLDAGRKE